MNPKVSIIILNWNGWKDTIECLESLYQITYPNYDVIVVDNGSKDDSIEKIKEYCEGEIKVESQFFEYSSKNKPIKYIEYTREEAEAGGGKEEEIADLPSNRRMIIIKNEKNYGFAEGNNIAIRYALKALNPDYILLLNNDTVVDKEFLGELVKVGESDKKIGSVQAKLLKKNNPKIIDSLGQEMLSRGVIRDSSHGETYNIKIKTSYEIFDPCAAAALYSVRALLKTGLFDHRLFTLFEDVDLSWRLRLAGYKNYLNPTAIVYHKRGVSYRKRGISIKNIITNVNSLRLNYNLNSILIIIKYYPIKYLILFAPIHLLILLKAIKSAPTKSTIKIIWRYIKERKAIQCSDKVKDIQDGWIIEESFIYAYIRVLKTGFNILLRGRNK